MIENVKLDLSSPLIIDCKTGNGIAAESERKGLI
jgi:hypothetical protein